MTKPKTGPREIRLCVKEGCNNAFELYHGSAGQNRIYCSVKCRWSNWDLKNREHRRELRRRNYSENREYKVTYKINWRLENPEKYKNMIERAHLKERGPTQKMIEAQAQEPIEVIDYETFKNKDRE